MPVPQVLDSPQRANQMAFGALFAYSEQGVCRAAERRNHNDRLALQACFDDVGRALDRRRITDGRSSELDDNHAAGSLPVAARSSAFSTEPPAAPRIVLCPSATIRRSSIESARTLPTVTVMPAPA